LSLVMAEICPCQPTWSAKHIRPFCVYQTCAVRHWLHALCTSSVAMAGKSVTMASAAADNAECTMAGVFVVHTYTSLPAACAAAVAAADAEA
jgi:hypothetical protein